MRWIVFAAFVLLPPVATAQDVTGVAKAIDGDSLDMAGIVIRLHGIDAPEYKQSCDRGGSAWACGKDAADRLAALSQNRELRCEQRDLDNYGRIVATCRVGGIDLADAMVEAGFAVALPQFSDRYRAAEARARAAGLGIWASRFEQPADYRAKHRPVAAPRAGIASARPRAAGADAPAGVYYPNCKTARAAGAAPLYRGQPGYRPEMDGDADGIACEPYRGR